MARKKPTKRTRKEKTVEVDSTRHKDKRKNIPTRELQDFVKDDEAKPKAVLYPRDPSLDPQLVWKGKDEQDSEDLAVPAVPVYIQEKIHPQAIVEDVRKAAEAGKGSKDPDILGAAKALRRSARRALELGRRTGTPVYVFKDGEIIDLTAQDGPPQRRGTRSPGRQGSR